MGWSRLSKVALTCSLGFIFTVASLLPPFVRPALAVDADQPFPLPVPEDPLGQQPEQQIPEISVQADIRDAHLVARVVDIWGPGRTPLVVRSYTNAESSSTSAAGGWQFNQHLDILAVTLGGSIAYKIREPGGNRTLYVYSTTRYDATRANRWDVYVDNIGEYTTMELHYTCQVVGGQEQCTWDGLYMVYLPKGATRRLAANGSGFGLIQEARDANGNVTTFAWTSLPSQIRAYIASVTDPVSRVTTYSYEQAVPQGSLWHYRVKSVTDPYGRTASYTYDTANHLISSLNAAGRTTSYGYNARGLLASVTNPRGQTTSIDWSGGGALWFGDTFHRPDSSTIVAAGTSWVEVENHASAMQIVGNAVRLRGYTGGSFPDEGIGYWNVALADQHSELQDSLGGDDRDASVVAVRVGAITPPFTWNNGNNVGMGGGYGLQYHKRGRVVRLVRYGQFDQPHAGTVLASAALPSVNDIITRMRIEAIGSKIRGVLNFANIPTITLEASDTTYTSGFPAIAAGPSINASGLVGGDGWRWDGWMGGAPPQVTKVTLTEGAATNYTYDSATLTTTVTNARGYRTTYTTNSAGDVVKVTNHIGNTTQYAYDVRHNVTSLTDARGNATTYSYNSRNKVTQIVQASGTLNLTTTLTWDGNDNPLSVTNPRGIQTDYTYDSKHNLTSVRRAVGTPQDALTQYAYTSWGGVASVTDPRGNTTNYTYTARRQVQTITPPVGGATSFGYDTADDQVSMTNGNGKTWTTTYNVSRQVTSVTDSLGSNVTYAYDTNGNRTSTTDGKNQTTTFAYDTRDRLITITDPLNARTAYQYDAVGNLTKITNARNAQTNFVNDFADRLIQVYDAVNEVTNFTYDAVGNRVSMFDRRLRAHSYSYDQANRLTQVSAGGVTVSYTYDANGNRLTMIDPTGTTTYTYDVLDRVTRTAYPDGKSVQFAYDKVGNRTSLTYPSGTVSLTYGYDTANRLTAMTQGTLQWTIGYDAAGNRISLTQPNGASTAYTYLANNWLSLITHKAPGGSVLQSFSYTYDANGNRISVTDPSGTTNLAYDALNRLTQAVYPGQCGTATWAYDAVGNRTSQITQQKQGQSCLDNTTLYAYDTNNRLTSAGSVNYSYDGNGNLTSTSAGQTFTYDPFNRLTQATGSGGTVTHTYNGDGLKVRRVGPEGTTLYYYEGIRPIWETDTAGALKAELNRDVFGNLISRREGTTRRFYHADGLGSMTLLTDASGRVDATMLYDAWGQVRTSSGRDHGKYRYTAAEFDEATGLYHMGARFYDPALGRWLSEDPVQYKQFEPESLNFYAYVANNPLVRIDPSGLMPESGASGSASPQKKSFGEIVLEWVKEFGEPKAAVLVRQAWDAINDAVDALAKTGLYNDFNLTVAVWAGITAGVIHDAENRAYVYAGFVGGYQQGLTYTIGLHGVTPGWNIAVSGTLPAGFAMQLGTALGCFAACNYREYGVSTPIPGASVAIFYIWRVSR